MDDLPVFLARAKAQAIAPKFPADIILAADTIVALDSQVIGKAADPDDARRILGMLSGSTHRVITGIALLCRDSGLFLSETVSSTVEMNSLTPSQIEAYIATNHWRGKAGAYGIQDTDTFVRRITGCLTNIVGLPMTTTARLLREAGIGAPNIKD
jgi:septum formation protein